MVTYVTASNENLVQIHSTLNTLILSNSLNKNTMSKSKTLKIHKGS